MFFEMKAALPSVSGTVCIFLIKRQKDEFVTRQRCWLARQTKLVYMDIENVLTPVIGNGWTPAVQSGLVSKTEFSAVEKDIVSFFQRYPQTVKDAAYWFGKTTEDKPTVSDPINDIIATHTAAIAKKVEKESTQVDTDMVEEKLNHEAKIAADLVVQRTIPYATDEVAMRLSWKTVSQSYFVLHSALHCAGPTALLA